VHSMNSVTWKGSTWRALSDLNVDSLLMLTHFLHVLSPDE